jgi:antitoxin component YwqK of YwqJK toxin-antitoxin module
MLGYKIARHQVTKQDPRLVIVTLEIPKDAKTNLHRKNIINPYKAKYRCNKAKVLKIEDVKKNKVYHFAYSHYPKKLFYIPGEVTVENNYNEDINVIDGEGIHFYLDKYVALYNNVRTIKEGFVERWWPNGNKASECNIIDYKKEGLYQEWNKENHLKSVECFYKNDKLVGVYKEWWENGQKRTECNYKDGNLDGLFQRWFDNGEKWEECTYRDGEKV